MKSDVQYRETEVKDSTVEMEIVCCGVFLFCSWRLRLRGRDRDRGRGWGWCVPC